MKIILSSLLAIFLLNSSFAQITLIPDTNFEQALINLGYDNTIDGSVLTVNINTIDSLNVNSSNIIDLTGIEDFTSLTRLHCVGNQLTSLNVSQNTLLTYLDCQGNLLTTLDVTQNIPLSLLSCSGNPITSLDVTQNSSLSFLNCNYCQLTTLDVTQNTSLNTLQCGDNQLSNLDVTQNTVLDNFSCFDNQLTSLDVTQNTALTRLICSNNQLICLNVKNGNNTNFVRLFTQGNPNLTCIEVDNIAYSTTSWVGIYFSFDATSSFSTNCSNPCTVGVKENTLTQLSIYPNPTNGVFTINLGEVRTDLKATLTNSLGQVILTQQFESTDFINISIKKITIFQRLSIIKNLFLQKVLYLGTFLLLLSYK